MPSVSSIQHPEVRSFSPAQTECLNSLARTFDMNTLAVDKTPLGQFS